MKALLFAASLLWIGTAGAIEPMPGFRDNSAYPCDVFSSSFCFRKPYKTVAIQRPGPDFTVYGLEDDEGHHLFSIYAGMHPQRPKEGEQQLKKFKRHGVDVEINRVAQGVLEVRLSYSNGVRLHIFGVSKPAGHVALAEVMTSFRVCSRDGFTSLDCRSDSLFGPAVVDLVRKLE